MYKIKDSDSSFELTIWQKEMGSNSFIEQTYLKPFILDKHYEVAVTQINLPHTWINVDIEANEMKLITKGKSVSFSKGCYRTVADVARGVQKALGGGVIYEHVQMIHLESLSWIKMYTCLWQRTLPELWACCLRTEMILPRF